MILNGKMFFSLSLFIGHNHLWKSLSCNGVFLCALDCGSCDKHSKILTIKVKCRDKMHVFDLNCNMLDVEA